MATIAHLHVEFITKFTTASFKMKYTVEIVDLPKQMKLVCT